MTEIDKLSLCEIQDYSNPPETVKVTFGIYMNFYLDDD